MGLHNTVFFVETDFTMETGVEKGGAGSQGSKLAQDWRNEVWV